MTNIKADKVIPGDSLKVQNFKEPEIPSFMIKKMSRDREYRKAKFWLTAAFTLILIGIDILLLVQLIMDIAR